MPGADRLEPEDDMAGGDTPSGASRHTLAELVAEGASRRRHRTAAAWLVYLVVAILCISIKTLVFKLTEDISKVNPSVVALTASLVVAVSVLTVALAKFSFGISAGGKGSDRSEDKDTPTAPSIEGIKLVGELVGKLGEILKSMKP